MISRNKLINWENIKITLNYADLKITLNYADLKITLNYADLKITLNYADLKIILNYAQLYSFMVWQIFNSWKSSFLAINSQETTRIDFNNWIVENFEKFHFYFLKCAALVMLQVLRFCLAQGNLIENVCVSFSHATWFIWFMSFTLQKTIFELFQIYESMAHLLCNLYLNKYLKKNIYIYKWKF